MPKNPIKKWLENLGKTLGTVVESSDPTKPTVISVHINEDNCMQSIDQFMTALTAACSVLASGIAGVLAAKGDIDQPTAFRILNHDTSTNAKQLLDVVKNRPLAISLLSLVQASALALEAYKLAVNQHIDRQKDANGRFPCGHTEEEHDKMSEQELAKDVHDRDDVIVGKGMRGVIIDQ